MLPLVSLMLAFLGTLFISRFFKLHFRLFIPTFYCREDKRNAATE